MKIRNELQAGVFIVICLTFIIALIFIMGRDRQIFASQSEYYTSFQDVKGLAEGAPVRLGGIPIGRVKEVGFSRTDIDDSRVHVTLLINDTYLDRIRKDSTASIDTQGLLGDRFISMSSGSEREMLPPKSELGSMEISDISMVLARAQRAVDNTTEITERINKALEGLKPETITAFGDAAKQTSEILAAVKSEKGFFHRLIYSEKEGQQLVEGISKATKDVSDMVAEVKNGKGLLNALIYSPSGKDTLEQYTAAARGIAEASENFATILAAAKDGKGLIHDLIFTEVEPGAVTAKAQQVLASLQETADNLRLASDALSKGTGTLGALLVDPKLYDNLVEVTDGAKRSFILRQAIRSSLK